LRAAEALYQLLADRQSNACTPDFLAVEPVKYGENLLSVLHFETDTVILHREQPVAAAPLSFDAMSGDVSPLYLIAFSMRF